MVLGESVLTISGITTDGVLLHWSPARTGLDPDRLHIHLRPRAVALEEQAGKGDDGDGAVATLNFDSICKVRNQVAR